jgi:UDP-GlcNAc:undecaprenyl-phosphate GlcNAc-1-phosphate transferase
MNQNITLAILGIISFLLGMLIIPILRKIAYKINFTDKPNPRKVHLQPIPLVGGISIAIVLICVLMISPHFIAIVKKYLTILTCGFILLIVGVIDDKTDLNAKFKLVIQLCLATIVVHNDTRISSFYGFLGINEINIYLQYFLTITVITGVVNAFNLMDGVDGLVGTLSFLGFTMLLIVSVFLKNIELATICTLFIGSILSFLKYNLSKKRKIFMGDSGTLFIGFVLITLGINILENEKINVNQHYNYLFLLLITFFSIPVLDSIRVYLVRIKNGNSPFKPDKSHLHHLFLSFGINHKKISLFIITMCMITFFIGFGLISLLSITLIVLSIIVTFIIFIKILLAIRDFNYWKNTIKKLENTL